MCATFKMHLRLQPLDVEIGEASFPLTRRRRASNSATANRLLTSGWRLGKELRLV